MPAALPRICNAFDEFPSELDALDPGTAAARTGLTEILPA